MAQSRTAKKPANKTKAKAPTAASKSNFSSQGNGTAAAKKKASTKKIVTTKVAATKVAATKVAATKAAAKPIVNPKPPVSKAAGKTLTKAASKKSATAATNTATNKSASDEAPVLASDASQHPHTRALLELRAFGLSYPETHLKSPWPGHLDLAVRDKTFAYLSVEGEPLHMSCKLPQSCQAALDLEFTSPTAYGLGKSGWVTADFKETDDPPVEFLKTWIDESYRAQAPKSLSKGLPKMTQD